MQPLLREPVFTKRRNDIERFVLWGTTSILPSGNGSLDLAIKSQGAINLLVVIVCQVKHYFMKVERHDFCRVARFARSTHDGTHLVVIMCQPVKLEIGKCFLDILLKDKLMA